MRICGSVVLFNPDDIVYENICSYLNLIDELIIIDNSKFRYDKVELLKKQINVKYIFNGENKGIAFALKTSLEYAKKNKFDWCLTMDQDSFVETSNRIKNDVLKILNANAEYGVISFDYNHSLKTDYLCDVKTWITSGNFVNVNEYKKIKGFNSDLFIDFVDFDICQQFYEKNIKIGIMKYSIKHNIGTPIEKKILGKKISSMNHNPIRYYYRYRNCYYLFKKNKKFYWKKMVYEWCVNFVKMLILEKNRDKKIKMIILGIKDAKRNKMGKYSYKEVI